MSNVVGLNKPNAGLVRVLEGLLREAEMGQLTSMTAVIRRNQETDFVIEAPELSTLEVIGTVEVLKAELLSSVD